MVDAFVVRYGVAANRSSLDPTTRCTKTALRARAHTHTHTHTHTLSLSHTRGPFTNCFDIRPHRHSFVYQRTCFSLSQASPELTRHPPSMMGMHAVCRKDKANSDDGRLVQRSLPAHVDQSHLAITLALNDVSLFVFGNAQQYAILTHAKEACQL